ncbi:MAG: biotin--[acetyl-CoA-carboxylase] ligase [Ancrocorticia sp.]
MDWSLTSAQAAVFLHTESTGSTQDDLAAIWPGSPDFTVLIADDQVAGRGRIGRQWHSEPGHSLLISVLVSLPIALREQLHWLTLIGGAAARAATGSERVKVKWPNDVVVDNKKIGGIIGEHCGESDGRISAVLGLGMNLSITEFPTPTAASLKSVGLPVPSRDELAAAWLAGLRERINAFEAAAGDPERSGVLTEINTHCDTLRPGIMVGRPANSPVYGTGRAVLADGSLEVATDGGLVRITAGEVSLFN